MIVKNLLVVGAVATLASVAVAEEKANWGINGRVRLDNVQMTTDTTPNGGTKGTTKTSELKLNRAEFRLVGERANDKMEIKYFAESNTLDTAQITHKLNDMMSLSLGKMTVLALSWENDYDKTDEYVMSAAGGYSPDNQAAAQLNLNFGEHSLALQVAQGVTSFTDGNPYATKAASTTAWNKSGGLTTAIQYRGEINKMIRPLVTYTVVKPSSSKTATSATATTAMNYGNGFQTQMGAGVQVDVSGAVIDAEFDSIKWNKLKDNEASKDRTTQSIILQGKYAIGMTTPFLKIAMDTDKWGMDSNIGDVSSTKLVVGVEHKLDATCRLHAVYANDAAKRKDSTAGDTKINSTTYNLGVTANL